VTQHGQQQKAKQGSGNLRLVLLAAAIGIPAALLAAVFLAFVHQLEHWLWTDLPHALGASHRPGTSCWDCRWPRRLPTR